MTKKLVYANIIILVDTNLKGEIYMPLTMARIGEPISIKKVGGKDDIRRFLESLGFVVGGNITLVSENRGDVIVNVKDSRVAISREMANKIVV